MLNPLGMGRKNGTACALLKTGQTTQYSSELDDGYYQKGVAKSYTINTTGAQSGTTNVDLVHLAASTAVSFDAASKEIRGTGLMGVFKAAGGETIVVTGSVSNNATFTTASATADKIVLTTAPTDESAGAPVVIAKREAISNNTVLDNNTGLTWLRYISSKQGTAGNGYMPWTGQPYDIFAFCAACNAASLGGYNDWRVANLIELYSIQKFEAPTGYPDSTAFPTAYSDIWSSNTVPSNTANALALNASGCNVAANAKTTTGRPKLVRGW